MCLHGVFPAQRMRAALGLRFSHMKNRAHSGQLIMVHGNFFPKIKKLIITSLLNLSSFGFQPLGFAATFSNTPENPSPNLFLKQLQESIVLVALYWDLPSTSRPLFYRGSQ